MGAPVVHYEIKNGEALREFYGQLFGWEFDVQEEQDYGLIAAATEGGLTIEVALSLAAASDPISPSGKRLQHWSFSSRAGRIRTGDLLTPS